MISFKSSAIAAALAVLTQVASANPFVFVDGHLQGNTGIGSYVKLEAWGVSSYSNTWDISGQAGFSPYLVFDSATAKFWFADDSNSDQDEFVTVNLGSVASWLNHTEVNGTFASYQLVAGDLNVSLLADIAVDGRLNYTVSVDSGDTYLKETQLTVHAHVPENGSTLALLGLALLGFGAVNRRWFRRA